MRGLVRRWYWLVLALVAVASGVYGVHRATRPPWADAEAWQKYHQVRFGMTEEEVRGVFQGKPPYLRVPGPQLFDQQQPWYPRQVTIAWRIGDDKVWVQLDTRDHRVFEKSVRVQGRQFWDPPAEMTWWDRWRTRLGW